MAWSQFIQGGSQSSEVTSCSARNCDIIKNSGCYSRKSQTWTKGSEGQLWKSEQKFARSWTRCCKKSQLERGLDADGEHSTEKPVHPGGYYMSIHPHTEYHTHSEINIECQPWKSISYLHMPFTANTMPAAFVKKNHQEPESCQSGLQSLWARHNDGKAVNGKKHSGSENCRAQTQFLQISAFFPFSNFRKRQIAHIHPVGWSIGRRHH